MGVLEDLMGKMDVLIVELSANTAARTAEKSGDAAADKPATGRGRGKAADKAPEPKYSEAQLVAKFDELKAKGGDIMPKLKKVIADCGFASLAELRQTPSKFDEAYAALDALDQAAAADDDL